MSNLNVNIKISQQAEELKSRKMKDEGGVYRQRDRQTDGQTDTIVKIIETVSACRVSQKIFSTYCRKKLLGNFFLVILQTFYANLVIRLEDGWRALYQCMETGMADVGNNDQNITS